MVFCGVFAIGLGFAAPAAKAAGGDDNGGASAGSGASGGTMEKKAKGMKKTDLTTCAPGQVWDKKTHKCLERHSGVLPDPDMTEYAYSLAKADRYQEAIDVLDMLGIQYLSRPQLSRLCDTQAWPDGGGDRLLSEVCRARPELFAGSRVSGRSLCDPGQIRLGQGPVGDDREALRIERLRVLRGSCRCSQDRPRPLREPSCARRIKAPRASHLLVNCIAR